MIKVDPWEPIDPAWKAWRDKARLETDKLKKAWQEWFAAAKKDPDPDPPRPTPQVDDKLYKAMKKWFLEFFHGKCAYCETSLQTGQPGDVEHFRPKGRVQDEKGKKLNNHGYYWLAYDWMNLIMACALCNRPNTVDSMSIGKWDKFPVVDERMRALKPGDEQNEPRLLIHPYLDNPAEHLVFDDTGLVAHKSPQGEKTIAILGLNREGLKKARRAAYRAAVKAHCDLYDALLEVHTNPAKIAECKEGIQQIKDGATDYCAVRRVALAKGRAALVANGLL